MCSDVSSWNPTFEEGIWAALWQRLSVRWREVSLPRGYELTWGGQFQHLQEATSRLAVVVPITLLLILGVLSVIFGAMRPALLIFSMSPWRYLVASWPSGYAVCRSSISAVIGFIALFGIAVLNGVVLVSHIRLLETEGLPTDQAVTREPWIDSGLC